MEGPGASRQEVAEIPEVTEAAVEEDETVDLLFDDVIPEEVPDDPDAAVAWLDQLVDSDDDFDIEMEPPPIKPSEDAVYVTDDALVDEADQPEPVGPEGADEAAEFSLEGVLNKIEEVYAGVHGKGK